MTQSPKTILIVDDEPDMCWALEHILGRMGYDTHKVFNGEQALGMVAEKHFPLAFLDAKLPDMEGLDLAARIRQIDTRVRILLVSGYFYQNDKEVQQALARGLILGFIAKPIDHAEIQATIRGCLS